MKKLSLNATFLRIILVLTFIIASGLLVGGFYFAQNWLNDFALKSNIGKVSSTTNSSGSTGNDQSGNELRKLGPVVDKVNGFVATSKEKYETDIGFYASKLGVAATTTYSTTVPTSITTPPPMLQGVVVGYITIAINKPLDFSTLIKFTKAIETNIPKMKLSGISIKHDPSAADSVTVEPLIVEVYTKGI